MLHIFIMKNPSPTIEFSIRNFQSNYERICRCSRDNYDKNNLLLLSLLAQVIDGRLSEIRIICYKYNKFCSMVIIITQLIIIYYTNTSSYSSFFKISFRSWLSNFFNENISIIRRLISSEKHRIFKVGHVKLISTVNSTQGNIQAPRKQTKIYLR